MSLTAAHLDALILSGCTAEQIVALVKADMAEREANLVVRRVKDAERQRRRRSRGVTRTRRDAPPIESIHTPPEASEDKSSSPPTFVLPADIPADSWAGWIDMRKRIKKSPTAHAQSLAVTELRRLRDEEGWPPGDVLNHCTMNSYQGIYPPKGRANGKSVSQQLGKTTAAIAANGGFGDDTPM
jgi:hypothetical protein